MSLVERLRRCYPASTQPADSARSAGAAGERSGWSADQLVRALRRQISQLERARPAAGARPAPRAPEPFSAPDYPAAATPALIADAALLERIGALAALSTGPRRSPPAPAALRVPVDPESAAAWCTEDHRDPARGLAAEEVLFLDTETTGLARSAGTVVFLIGVGGFWGPGGSLAIDQLFVEHPEREAEVLRALAPYLARARLLVTFNGASFDLPLLRVRAALHREALQLAQAHLDLLAVARYHFGARLSNCRLVTIERELLGLAREHDIDGADVPALYADFLRHGRRAGIQRIAEHNHRDVGSLALLLERLTRHVLDPLQWAEDAAELCATGIRQLRRGDAALGEACLQRALTSRLPGHLRHRATVALAAQLRRTGRSRALEVLWEGYRQALPQSSSAQVALAKYHEHVTGDLARAAALLRTAPALAVGDSALLHRLRRLQRKLTAR
ncbi:MAG: ribonuclease H-like domain-containing protein [Proteobacteria bacterium]|nr:ribonuclease H-like domain-containing protein [Pseudomonadota bacterium]